MNKKLMALFIGLLSLFFISVYIIAINFGSVKSKYKSIEPDLDNYSAAEILYLSFEKLRSTFLIYGDVNSREFILKKMVLTSKINILNNHATFSDAFFYDKDFLSALKKVQDKNKQLNDVFSDFKMGKISRGDVLAFFNEMELEIIGLQEVIYRVQIKNFNEVTSVIANNALVAEVFSVLSIGLFLGIVFLFLRHSFVLKGIIKSKNIFISSIYHELATSMQKIVMSVELIEDNEQQHLYQKELNMISYHSLKVIEQARDILDYSRIEIGQLQTTISPFWLNNLINDALKSVNNKGNNKIVFYNFARNDLITSDKYKISRILINLIDNACKNTYSGAILITLRSKKDFYAITIKDNGVGLDIKKLKHYFQAFNQEVKGETKQGLGLGLTIVKNYLSVLSGTLLVNSIKGQGSSFAVYLPKKIK